MAGVSKKISAASARSHTRKSNQRSSSQPFLGTIKKILVFLWFGFLAWVYQTMHPLPPRICGTPGGPPITAPRIKLRDGRHLAYKNHGVSKEIAKYKIIFVHGSDTCRHDAIVPSTEIVEELELYMVSFDRPGYGESDPDPWRTVKSLALDIEELADQLGLGSKFHVIGFSMGGHGVWGCLKYIPNRLAGATLLAPVINYWWPGFPANLSEEAYHLQPPHDQWALRIAHYTPWLTFWWNTQNWFYSSSVVASMPEVIFSRQDIELLPKLAGRQKYQAQVKQQGVHESILRDMKVGFGSWEFDPMDLKDPFPNNEGSVHLWNGDEDLLVPVTLQRYISKRLPWIHYHEIPGAGHLFPYADGMIETIIKSLLFGEK